jgi:hypothetical protein
MAGIRRISRGNLPAQTGAKRGTHKKAMPRGSSNGSFLYHMSRYSLSGSSGNRAIACRSFTFLGCRLLGVDVLPTFEAFAWIRLRGLAQKVIMQVPINMLSLSSMTDSSDVAPRANATQDALQAVNPSVHPDLVRLANLPAMNSESATAQGAIRRIRTVAISPMIVPPKTGGKEKGISEQDQ